MTGVVTIGGVPTHGLVRRQKLNGKWAPPVLQYAPAKTSHVRLLYEQTPIFVSVTPVFGIGWHGRTCGGSLDPLEKFDDIAFGVPNLELPRPAVAAEMQPFVSARCRMAEQPFLPGLQRPRLN